MNSERTDSVRQIRIVILIGCLILVGGCLDFFISGILKIIWAVVYVPAFIVGAKVVIAQVSRTRLEKHSASAAVAFVAGAVIFHLTFMNSSRLILYPMKLTSMDPLTLGSGDWPQKLIISSAKLDEVAPSLWRAASIPVEIAVISDYGCNSRSTVESVAGVPVEADSEARWTWKLEPQIAPPLHGPGFEDSDRHWCRIHFYRRS